MIVRVAQLLVAFMCVVAAAAAHADGRICTSNDVLLFGDQPVGSAVTQTATVTNCGDQGWSFTDASVHPATGSAYQVNSSCVTSGSLAPGETCVVNVRFAFSAHQTSARARTSSLRTRSNVPRSKPIPIGSTRASPSVRCLPSTACARREIVLFASSGLARPLATHATVMLSTPPRPIACVPPAGWKRVPVLRSSVANAAVHC